MKLYELFESDSVKQDELRAKVRKWRSKSKNNNPKHEYDEVEGKGPKKPEYVALGGHAQRGLSGPMTSD